MNKNEVYINYCTGCGLCKAVDGIELSYDKKGFKYPNLKEITFHSKVCPSAGILRKKSNKDFMWGYSEGVYLGYAQDHDIRTKASSGGSLTAICCYLLDNKMVDGIIHIEADNKEPLKTKNYVSLTSEEVIKRCGSRYTISSPLENILDILDENGKYAFIGKPCDVQILKSYMQIDQRLVERIYCTLSFFCAGVPSLVANTELVREMGCEPNDIKTLSYRGNGWPGYATAVDYSGRTYQMDYDSAWGKILGRDKLKMCRTCMDGVGEYADISCGDAWYLQENGKPDFSEREGRNVIFARNQCGVDILRGAEENNYIYYQDYLNYKSELPKIQKYQFERKATMISQISALKLTFRTAPLFKIRDIIPYAKFVPISIHLKVFWGTLKRIIRGRYN